MAISKRTKAVVDVVGPEADSLTQLDRARLAAEILKTLIVAYTARTGSGFKEDDMRKLAQVAKVAVVEIAG